MSNRRQNRQIGDRAKFKKKERDRPSLEASKDKKSSNDRKLIEIWKTVTEGDAEEDFMETEERERKRKRDIKDRIVSDRRRGERGNIVDNSKQNGKFQDRDYTRKRKVAKEVKNEINNFTRRIKSTLNKWKKKGRSRAEKWKKYHRK